MPGATNRDYHGARISAWFLVLVGILSVDGGSSVKVISRSGRDLKP